MTGEHLIFALFLIFAGAALFSTVALLIRLPMLVAYMLLGVLLGPWGLNLINDTAMVSRVGDVGIIFLLFLLGLHLPLHKLREMLRQVSWIGLVSSCIFMFCGYAIGWLFGYSEGECLLIGAAMMFSSTIIGIKLLPTTILHHQHTGEVMISVLLLQDLIAITVLLLLRALAGGQHIIVDVGSVLLGFPVILVSAYLFERWILQRLFAKFNRIKEYLFLVAIAWCLGLSQLAAFAGLSDEIGAFIAGVSLAASPLSLYLAESLKPVRDFFLVMFFFAVGAIFNIGYLPQVIVPALLISVLLVVVKPIVYWALLCQVGESKAVSWEVGVRLGQVSEFSLILAYAALGYHLINDKTAYLIEAVTIITFVISSFWVVMRYPTPVSLSDRLRRD